MAEALSSEVEGMELNPIEASTDDNDECKGSSVETNISEEKPLSSDSGKIKTSFEKACAEKDKCKSSSVATKTSEEKPFSALEQLVLNSYVNVRLSPTAIVEHRNLMLMLKGGSNFDFAPAKAKYKFEKEPPKEKTFLQLEAPNLMDHETPCVFCDEFRAFDIDTDQESFREYARHLAADHGRILAKGDEILEKRLYFINWKNVLSGEPGSGCFGTNRGADARVREELKMVRLKKLLSWKEYERGDSHYQRRCFVCRERIRGTRHDFVQHLKDDHCIKLGDPDDLVNIEQLLDLLESQLTSNQCFHCGGFYPSGVIAHFRQELEARRGRRKFLYVSEHMTEFDRFYLVNYLEPGRSWKEMLKERTLPSCLISADDENETENFSGWREKDRPGACLFCPDARYGIKRVFEHMKAEHGFDFEAVTSEMEYFSVVRMVNYVRRTAAHFWKINSEEEVVTNVDDIIKLAIEDASNWNGQGLQLYRENDEIVQCFGGKAEVPREVCKEQADIHDVINRSILRY